MFSLDRSRRRRHSHRSSILFPFPQPGLSSLVFLNAFLLCDLLETNIMQYKLLVFCVSVIISLFWMVVAGDPFVRSLAQHHFFLAGIISLHKWS